MNNKILPESWPTSLAEGSDGPINLYYVNKSRFENVKRDINDHCSSRLLLKYYVSKSGEGSFLYVLRVLTQGDGAPKLSKTC